MTNSKEYPDINELEKVIEEIWTAKIKGDFLENRFIYYESSLVACFYYHLRSFID